MTRFSLWIFLAIAMVLAACLGEPLTPDGSSTSVPATADPDFPCSFAGEHHPDATTSKHTRIHCGERHVDTGLLDGNGHLDTDPRAKDCHTYTSDPSCDKCLANPSGHRGVRPVPMEALDRRGWRLLGRPAGSPHLGEPG